MFFLIPLSVLFSSLTIIPNRILLFSALLFVLIRNRFFLRLLLKKKLFLMAALFYSLLILFGNAQLSKEAILFLTLPIYFIIYSDISLNVEAKKKYFVLAVFSFSAILLIIKFYKIVLFGLRNFFQQEHWWNQLLYKNLSQDINGHPTYISMFLLSAIVLLLHAKEFRKSYFSMYQYMIIQIVLLFVLFLCAAKISYVATLLIILTFITFIFRKRSKKTIGVAILFLILASIITFQTPGIKQRMFSDLQALSTSKTKYGSENKLNERLALWEASILYIENNQFIGTSLKAISSKSGIYPKAKSIYPDLADEKKLS